MILGLELEDDHFQLISFYVFWDLYWCLFAMGFIVYWLSLSFHLSYWIEFSLKNLYVLRIQPKLFFSLQFLFFGQTFNKLQIIISYFLLLREIFGSWNIFDDFSISLSFEIFVSPHFSMAVSWVIDKFPCLYCFWLIGFGEVMLFNVVFVLPDPSVLVSRLTLFLPLL